MGILAGKADSQQSLLVFPPPPRPTSLLAHLLLRSPSCTHQTYIQCPLRGQGSQSALPTAYCANPPRTGNLQRIFNQLNVECDQYLDWV